MKKIASIIVKLRYLLSVLFVILVVVCGIMMSHVNVNYDMFKYLNQDSESTVALNKMVDEFGSAGQASVMIKNINAIDASNVKIEIESIDGVNSVIFDAKNETCYKDNCALYNVYLKTGDFEQASYQTIDKIKETLKDYDLALTGAAVVSKYLTEAASRDMAKILTIACVVVFVILLLTSSSWIEPIMFGIIVAGAIIINMGTNIFMGEISFITKSICAVMQLALAMDYSIILLHEFNKEKTIYADNKEAMIQALAHSFKPVSSSSITTIAGLVALMLMSFSIGFDVGAVLAKGILISLLTVFIFMPGILLLFSKLIEKTAHQSVFEIVKSFLHRHVKKENAFAKFQYHSRIIIPVIVALLIIVGCCLNYNSKYSYQLETSSDQNASINIETKEIEEKFGVQNPVVVLLPKGDIAAQQEVLNYLINYQYQGVKVINGSQGMVTTGVYNKYSADELATMFEVSPNLVSTIYTNLGVDANGKITMDDVITYLNSNAGKTFLGNYLKTSKNDVALKVKTYEKYFVPLNQEQMASATGLNISMVADIYEKQNSSSLSIADFLTYIRDNDYLTITGNVYQNNFDTKKNEVAPFFDETTRTEALAFIALYENNPEAFSDEEYQAKYTSYKQALAQFTKEQILINYPFFTENTVKQMFMFYETETTLANYQIITFISNNQIAKQALDKAQESVNTNASSLAPLLINLDEIAIKSNLGLPSSIAKLILNGDDKLKTFDVLKAINDHDYITLFGNSLTNQLSSTYASVNYAKSMFETDKYCRLIFNLNMDISNTDSFEAIKEINNHIQDNYGSLSKVVCSSFVYSDIKDVFNSDMVVVNLVSFFAILIIVAFTFKSWFTPILLTSLIQGSIWIAMGINTLTGNNIFFVCYLVVMCIQMGATVDYAILLTTKYIENRKTMSQMDSIHLAMEDSIMTILTSGSILVLATFIIGLASDISIISSLGMLLSRGCLISVLLIIFALPQILILCDKIISKSSYKTKFIKEK